jgi:hypothetical protein
MSTRTAYRRSKRVAKQTTPGRGSKPKSEAEATLGFVKFVIWVVILIAICAH